ncbi:uncharacterized protein METZ01_LOCUS123306 [marine metagenome]|uniref:Uncharacterized protein n=1 Tax=marine metagenome TaxID=408172 RepID=A0A381Y183_9ZZZZ
MFYLELIIEIVGMLIHIILYNKTGDSMNLLFI